MGEGSVQYAVTAFWSAAAYKVPVTFLVLRNEEYAILKWFAGTEQVTGRPGLDLPALNTAAIAAGYGVKARRVDGLDELRSELATAIASGAAGADRGGRRAGNGAVLGGVGPVALLQPDVQRSPPRCDAPEHRPRPRLDRGGDAAAPPLRAGVAARAPIASAAGRWT